MARAAEAAQERFFPQQSLYANHFGIKLRNTAIKVKSKTNGNLVVHCMVLFGGAACMLLSSVRTSSEVGY
jgi:hypothetical protein